MSMLLPSNQGQHVQKDVMPHASCSEDIGKGLDARAGLRVQGLRLLDVRVTQL